MPVVGRYNLLGGLHTGYGDATPDHASDVVNFFASGGRLKKRAGMVPVEAIAGLQHATRPHFGWGVSAEPGSVANAGNVTAPASANQVYAGHATQFNRVVIVGSPRSVATDIALPDRSDLTVQYWNGTAWATLEGGWLFSTSTQRGSASGSFMSNTCPFLMFDFDAVVAWTNSNQIDLVFIPPSDWATKAIAGQTKYWLRVTGWGTTDVENAVAALGSSYVHTTENRVLNVLTWKDRYGQPHRFVAYLYGADGKALRFSLDGTVLTQSAGLQPDGTSVMFGERTLVDSFYHAPTNRVVGRIGAHQWFYLVPGNGEIYNLVPDVAGTDTAYASLVRGLRGAIPDGKHVVVHDGRIFTAVGEALVWSAPGVYVDIWPSNNEMTIADAYGEITGLASFGGTLALFKRNAIYTVQSDGTSEGYFATPFPGGVGAVGAVTPCGNFCAFVAADGIYVFDGNRVEKLSAAVDEAFDDRSLTSDAAMARGVFHAPENQYRIFLPSSGQSTLMDKALYVGLDGFTPVGDTEKAPGATIWPQGKYSDTDFSFNATAVCEDHTGQTPRSLVGDRYGVVWDLDQGLSDGGSPVKAKLTQTAQNDSRAQTVILRTTTVGIVNEGDQDFTMKMIPDTRDDLAQSITVTAYKTGDPTTALEDAGSTENGTDTEPGAPVIVNREVNFGTRVREFQLGIVHATLGPLELIEFEVEANPGSRRFER